MKPNVNVTVGGPVKPTNYTYKTVILKSNLPFAAQIGDPNCIYVIKWDFDLKGQSVTIPENCILKFEGGSISNGTIVGYYTTIDASPVKIFNTNIKLDGTWNVEEAYPEWFGAKGDGLNDDTEAIFEVISSFENIKFRTDGVYRITKTVVIQPNRIIDFNGCTLYWDGVGAGTIYGAVFKTDLHETGISCSATEAIVRGNNYIVVSEPSLFDRNDVVLISSPEDTVRPYKYVNKLAKIVKIEESKLYLNTKFSFDCDLDYGIDVKKIIPNENIVIKNGHFTSKLQAAREDGMSAIILNYSTDSLIENCTIEKFWFNGIAIRISNGVCLSNITVKDPPPGAGYDSGNGGDAYGIQFNYADNCIADKATGHNLRHLTDCTCACNILIRNFEDYYSISTSFNHHSCYEDGVTYERCKSYNSHSYAFAVGTDPSNSFGRTSWNIKLIDCEAYNCGSYALAYYNEGYGLIAKNCKFYSRGSFGACFGNNGCLFDGCEFNRVIITKADYINDNHKSVITNSKIINDDLSVQVVTNQFLEINNSYIGGKIFIMDGGQITLDNVLHKGSRIVPPFQFDYTQGGSNPHEAVTDTEKIIIRNSYLDWTELLLDVEKRKRYFAFAGKLLDIIGTTIYLGEDESTTALEVPISFCAKHTKLTNNNMIGRFQVAQDLEDVIVDGNYMMNPITFVLRLFGSADLHKFVNNNFVGTIPASGSISAGFSIFDYPAPKPGSGEEQQYVVSKSFIFKDNVIKGVFSKGTTFQLEGGIVEGNVIQGTHSYQSLLPEPVENKVFVEKNIWDVD